MEEMKKDIVKNNLTTFGKITYYLGVAKLEIKEDKYYHSYRKWNPLTWLVAAFMFLAIAIVQLENIFEKLFEELEGDFGYIDKKSKEKVLARHKDEAFKE